jgi:ComF family protein
MKLKEFLLSTLFPSRCFGCSTHLTGVQAPGALCVSCAAEIPVCETLFCVVCRARLADGKRICHSKTPLRLASVGRYENKKLRGMVTGLKYRRQTIVLNTLRHLIRRYLHTLQYDFSTYVVVPIPLHKKRERERGFNQSLLIAEIVAAELHLPLLREALLKTRSTKPQAKTVDRTERKSNLIGCFEILDQKAITGQNILLVDDVCTSGSTLIEAAQTLKASGAREIIGFVIARTD